MIMSFPLPRSILFVPAVKTEWFEKAAKGEADALCFDLEDSVDAASKMVARDNLASACALADGAGKIPMVRINAEAELVDLDLAALPQSCKAVLLPKVRDLEHVNVIAGKLDAIDEAGWADAHVIALIEDAAALLALENTFSSAHPRVLALYLGCEDFSNALGCDPDSRLIQSAFERTAILASAMDVSLLGFPGSIANFTDLDALRDATLMGSKCGSLGSLCIHPRQVYIMNDTFMSSANILQDAKRIVAAFEKAAENGEGVVALDGKMIDLPVYKRAKVLLARAVHY